MTQHKAATIGAVIPAYQAAPWVGDVVRRTLAVHGAVLVVDDGSTDGTAEVAREAGAEVVSHPENRGKGRALATAFDLLFGRGHEAVITLDADGQHLPEEIPALVSAWRDHGADLVLGSRHHLFADMAAVRRVSNTLSTRGIAILAGEALDDVQTGFRLYTRRLIEVTGFPEARFEAESAVVVRAVRRGFRVVTVPIRLAVVDGRRTSHYRPLVDSARIANAVIRARMEEGS